MSDKKYRLLNRSEIIRPGDQLWTGGVWDGFGCHTHGEPLVLTGPCRREITEPAPAGWIMCSDRMPTEADGDVVWWNGSHRFVRSWDYSERWKNHIPCIAWLPIPKFTPPAPEVKRVPLELDEIRTSWELKRGDQRMGIREIIPMVEFSVQLSNGHAVNPAKLMQYGYEYREAGANAWEPCSKLEGGEQ